MAKNSTARNIVETSDATRAVPTTCAIVIKGRGKAEREAAFHRIAPFAFVETESRDASIANLRQALGATPSEDEARIAREEWIIGRVAARLPASDVPNLKTEGARLNFARDLVLRYAQPVSEGAKATKLRAGKIGRRTPTQHKIVRAAEEAWSLVKAELGLGAAQTLAERNKAKRATNANPVRGAGKADGKADGKAGRPSKDATPTHAQLVTPAKPVTADEAHTCIMSQASTLLAYANKHAALIDGAMGSAVHAFKSACTKALSDLALRKLEAASEK